MGDRGGGAMVAGGAAAPRLLVVDEDPAVTALYVDEFSEEGYDVQVAGSGGEALALVEASPPDVVTLDIHMPGMDGLETLRKMKARRPHLPIVLSTAYDAYKDNFASWACDEYVVKSGDLTALKAAVRRALDCARHAGAR